MLKKLPHLLILMLLASCRAVNIDNVTQTIPASVTITVTAAPTTTLFSASQPDKEIAQLAEAYRALREIEGHFDGGEPNPVVDQWQGEKHRVMHELGERLRTGEYGRSELVALLGPPDHTVTEADPLHTNIASLPDYQTSAAGDEFLIYEWRGTHDFLFFVVQNEQVENAGWWYAGE
jgi:hypothetical protein